MSTDTFEGLPREVAVPRLIEEHGGRLYTLGKQFCGDPDEAEDLVQEVFMQAWRKWDQFEGRSNPGTWLYTIASRVCQRLHRKRAGEPDHFESIDSETFALEGPQAVLPDGGDPLSEQIRREGRERVEAAIAALPLDFRMPLVLKEVVGFSVAEVSAIVDIKEATVKTRLHRARAKLRDALDAGLPHGDGPPAMYSREVCLDLLQSKQDHLDRNLPFTFPDGVICERCAIVFATMDLAIDTCSDLAKGELPDKIRVALFERLHEA